MAGGVVPDKLTPRYGPMPVSGCLHPVTAENVYYSMILGCLLRSTLNKHTKNVVRRKQLPFFY